MNTLTDILKLMVLPVTLAWAVCSCADDNGVVPEPRPEVPEGCANVGFELTVSDSALPDDGARAGSRAPADGSYDPGNGLENYIDIPARDYGFYFFSNTPADKATDNKYIGKIDIVSFVQIASSPGMKRYTVVGSVPAELALMTDFKVCVLANWNVYPELMRGDDLSLLWSDAAAICGFNDGSLSDKALIPLYGIKEFSGVTFATGESVALGNIHLLRAYAKVEVNLDGTVYPVDKVTVTRVNARGYKAPAGVDTEAEYVHGAYEEDYVNTPYIPAGTDVLGEVEMHPDPAAPAGIRRYMIYLPEYDNTSAGAVKTRIRITYKPIRVSGDVADGTTPEDTPEDFRTPDDAYIDFRYYRATGSHAEGEVFDLLRSNWYRFNVSQGMLDLTVHVDVQPYAQVTLDPDFGLERDEEGYIIVRNNKGEVIKYIRPDGAELTLGPVDMPYYGVIRAVFDSKRRALIGYLPGGRMVYWNYDGADQMGSNMTSWEIYTDENDKTVDVHLDEDYIRIPGTNSGVDAFTHSFYDDKGRVIRRYVYPSNEAFEARTGDGAGGTELVSYTGSKYGAKEITYKDKTGEKYCTIKVTVNPDGTETETYSYY